MFKVVKNPTFTATVKVYAPTEGGVVSSSFTARFKALAISDTEAFNLLTTEGTLNYLRAILIGWEGVADEEGHPDLPEPIRLSTDNAVRISDDPYIMETRSTWRGSNPVTGPFLWVIASAILPGEAEDAPATAQVVLENLDSEMVELLTSFTDPATIHMAGVLASSPDDIEVEQLDMQIVSADVTAGEITLQISREDRDLEPCPPGRFTRMRFPGLHR